MVRPEAPPVQGLIAGRGSPAVGVIATQNPATGEVVATYDEHDDAMVEASLGLAAEAFEDYRHSSFVDRSRWMLSAAELLEGELPDWASTITTEMGKTFASAKGEVAKSARAMRYFAQHAEEMLRGRAVTTASGTGEVCYEPIGPVLAIMPWNFPLWQVVRFAAPALMAGNVGLLKHAPNVPATALGIEGLFRRAGFPEGVFQSLLVETPRVEGLIADPRVKAVTLTGSQAAGSAVASHAGRYVKKSVLELGGSDPFVVLASADLGRAVSVGVEARMQNNGQSCIAAKRFVVVTDVYDAFESAYVDAVRGLRVGDPMDPSTDIGPLVSARARDLLVSQLKDAREKGASLLVGGEAVGGAGYYFTPGVLAGVTPGMRVWHEEVFGPVALLVRAEDADEAMRIANDSPFGLGASVWSDDGAEQERFVRGLRAGMVFVNSMVSSMPELPFGGVGRSGYGRELGSEGIRELSVLKTAVRTVERG